MKLVVEQEFKEVMIQKILDLQAKIEDRIDSINRGGCGRFALRAHRALNKMGIRSEMQVCLSNWKINDIETNKVLLRNISLAPEREKDELSFVHSWIYLPDFDMSFDGAEMCEGKWENEEIHGDYNEKEMATVVRVGWWNPDYCPSQNKTLSRLIYGTLKL